MHPTKPLGSASPRYRFQLSRPLVLSALLVAELAIFALIVPNFFTLYGLLDTTRTFVEAGLIALAMTLVIISGGIDLSVGSLLALVAVAVGFSYQAGVPLPAALLLGLVVGTLGGALNGAFIAFLNLHPLVVTLGTLALFRGAAYAVTDAGAVSSFPFWFTIFGQSYVGNIVPVQLLIFLVFAVLVWLLLAKTALGRYIYAVGINPQVVRFSGVRVWRVKMAVYALTGFLVAVAAIINTSRVFTARANAASGLELTVIAMVVLGGARITGGSGSLVGTVLGVLILAYLQDGLILAGVRSDWGLIVTGLVLVLGVFLNEFFRRETL